MAVEELKTGRRHSLHADRVFVFNRMMPNLELFGSELEWDRWGYLVPEEKMQTRVPGMYALGDVRSKAYRQITISVGEGTVATMAIARLHLPAHVSFSTSTAVLLDLESLYD